MCKFDCLIVSWDWFIDCPETFVVYGRGPFLMSRNQWNLIRFFCAKALDLQNLSVYMLFFSYIRCLSYSLDSWHSRFFCLLSVYISFCMTVSLSFNVFRSLLYLHLSVSMYLSLFHSLSVTFSVFLCLFLCFSLSFCLPLRISLRFSFHVWSQFVGTSHQ